MFGRQILRSALVKTTRQKLKQFRADRALVSICRNRFDSHKIHGFVIDFSQSIVLIQNVYDFHVDGILLLRLADITDIETSATDEFQKELLIEEGDFAKIDIGYRPPIGSYDAFLRSLPHGEIVILEDEAADNPSFIIGTLMSVDANEVSVRFFTGVAGWEDEPSVIEIPRITSCQTRSNYINYYARHFARCDHR